MSDASYSIDEAVSVLTDAETIDSAPDPVETVENAPEGAADDGEQVSDGDQPSDVEAAEGPAEDKEGDVETPATVVEAPSFWSAEGKALFATLTPEAQAAILAEENSVKTLTAKKLEGTAAERKAAQAEKAKFTELTTRMAEAADKAESTFASRWDGITPEAWAALAESDPGKYTALRAKFDVEQQATQQARSAREAAAQAEHQEWLTEQKEALTTLCPALVDPVEGEKNLRELSEYLVKQGVEPDQLPHVGAREMSIARKAMLYDAGVQKLAQPRPPVPTRPGLKPSAADGATSQQRTSAAAMGRLQKSGSIDDAVDVLLARKQG